VRSDFAASKLLVLAGQRAALNSTHQDGVYILSKGNSLQGFSLLSLDFIHSFIYRTRPTGGPKES
jgi:hypothetical protein